MNQNLEARIEECKEELRHRARYANIDPYPTSHVEDGEYIYVFCNPIIGTARGEPRHNIQQWLDIKYEGMKVIYTCGLDPIIYPWLLVTLDRNGDLVADGHDPDGLSYYHTLLKAAGEEFVRQLAGNVVEGLNGMLGK